MAIIGYKVCSTLHVGERSHFYKAKKSFQESASVKGEDRKLTIASIKAQSTSHRREKGRSLVLISCKTVGDRMQFVGTLQFFIF
ncbi:hypothetical protein CEXT_177451 [Caerostris extrusa]|uniref:Uncharacterized protein n=1 Tax=Caerostris extrusa TaxID=172846 RepID=A0AAV4M9S8_CAEEX|nr:hypothetical protein CEXT_177451 [Caerostris extrusa]